MGRKVTGDVVKGNWVGDRNIRGSGSFGASSSGPGVRELPRLPIPSMLGIAFILGWGMADHGDREHTSSKTSFNLYCVKALHSTYFTAPSSFAILSPSSFR